MVAPKAGIDESKQKSVDANKTAVAGPGSFKGKLLLIASIPAVVLVAVLVQYAYNTYYIYPMEERTLLPQTPVNLDRKAWVVRHPWRMFTLGSRHPQSLLFSVFVNWDQDPAVEYKQPIYQKQWIEGDGKTFGKLSISSESLQATIQFVTLGESWTVRVSAKRDPRMPKSNHTLVHVLRSQFLDSPNYIAMSDDQSKLLSGYNPLMGNYSISFDTLASDTTEHFSTYNSEGDAGFPKSFYEQDVQFAIREGFDVEIAFSTADSKEIVANDFVDLYEMAATEFEEKFEKAYSLKFQNMPEFYQSMGKSALTNVLASVKYSHGSVNAISKLNPEFQLDNIEITALADSLERLPSKIDNQVFSLLTILPFEADTALQIITSWLNMMNSKGDVPTELDDIRPQEVRGQPPTDYTSALDYTSSQAPTVFYIIERILRTEEVKIFQDIFPKIEAFAKKMISTHTSFEKNLFKWNANTTFLSDYPRHIGEKQANLDLHCWMVIASRVMKKLSILGNNQYQYEQWNKEIDNQEFLLANFYDEEKKEFADTFLAIQNNKQVRGYVSDTTGFVSISPLVFELLPAESLHLKRILETIDNQEELFSSFGIRSLSKSSSHYVTDMAESSYRSDISIPANYLLLGALKHYSEKSSDNQAMAHVVYSKLRNTIISNVAREFKRTKTLWETYSDTTGRGKGKAGHNWSTLVLNIMAEKY